MEISDYRQRRIRIDLSGDEGEYLRYALAYLLGVPSYEHGLSQDVVHLLTQVVRGIECTLELAPLRLGRDAGLCSHG